MPEPAPPATGWLLERPFAHRGLHDLAEKRPENSLAAFQAALEKGYGIELDVRLTADRVPMVFHDWSLERLTGRQGSIHDTAAEEMMSLGLLGTDETVPSLARVLELVAGRVPLLIEIKGGGSREAARQAAEGTWNILRGYTGRFAVQSFDPSILGWFARHAADVVRGQISGSYGKEWKSGGSALSRFLLRNLLLNRLSRPHYIAYEVDVLPHPACLRAKRRGLPLMTWTVKTEKQREIARRHADNVIFENFLP